MCDVRNLEYWWLPIYTVRLSLPLQTWNIHNLITKENFSFSIHIFSCSYISLNLFVKFSAMSIAKYFIIYFESMRKWRQIHLQFIGKSIRVFIVGMGWRSWGYLNEINENFISPFLLTHPELNCLFSREILLVKLVMGTDSLILENASIFRSIFCLWA